MSFPVFVSCETYDDSEIKESLKDLENRIKALEDKVADNLAAIQSMISLGSVSSFDFNTETGKGVITLVGGNKITVDCNISGISLLTIVEKDGKYWWGICKDDETTLLEVNGKPVPVEVTPAAKISENGEWLLSADGGLTWVSTGIFQPENGGEDTDIIFFTDVKVDGNQLILTLADGTTVKVDIIGEAEFTSSVTSLWFTRLSEEKMVSLSMKNVKGFTITEKPEGWKAQIKEETLHITSPSDMAGADQSGYVKMLAVFESGKPEIVSIEVQYESELSLEADDFGSIHVDVSEHVGEDYQGYIVKAWKSADFTIEKAVEWLNTQGYGKPTANTAKTFTINEVADNYSANESYTVFAASYIPARLITAGTKLYTEADLIITTVSPVSVGVEVTQIKYDSAHIKASFAGMEQYYAGICTSDDWDYYVKDNLLEMLGWGNMTPYTAPSYNGPASGFPDGKDNINVQPNTSYTVWMLESKKGMYKESDFIIKTFKTPGLSSDASLAVPSYKVTEVTYGGFTAELTPVSGAYKTYASILNSTIIPETDLEIATMLIKGNKFSRGSEKLTISTNSFNADTEVYLLAVTVSEDGRYGKILREKVDLKTLSYSDAIGITDCKVDYGVCDVTLTLSFKGEPASISYLTASYTYYTDEMIEKMMAMNQLGDAENKKISELTNGNQILLTGLAVGAPYKFYAMVKDAEGTPSHLYTAEFTPIINVDYILSDSADYKYGMPELSGSWRDEQTYILNVKKPAECSKYWLYRGDPEYFTGDVWTDTDRLISSQLYGIEVYTESLTDKTYTTMYSDSRIYMAWLDNKGNYHAIYEYNPHK